MSSGLQLWDQLGQTFKTDEEDGCAEFGWVLILSADGENVVTGTPLSGRNGMIKNCQKFCVQQNFQCVQSAESKCYWRRAIRLWHCICCWMGSVIICLWRYFCICQNHYYKHQETPDTREKLGNPLILICTKVILDAGLPGVSLSGDCMMMATTLSAGISPHHKNTWSVCTYQFNPWSKQNFLIAFSWHVPAVENERSAFTFGVKIIGYIYMDLNGIHSIHVMNE